MHSLAKRDFRKGKTSLGTELLYTFLTESDVDVDLPDKSGNTALHLAVEVSQFPTIAHVNCVCVHKPITIAISASLTSQPLHTYQKSLYNHTKSYSIGPGISLTHCAD